MSGPKRRQRKNRCWWSLSFQILMRWDLNDPGNQVLSRGGIWSHIDIIRMDIGYYWMILDAIGCMIGRSWSKAGHNEPRALPTVPHSRCAIQRKRWVQINLATGRIGFQWILRTCHPASPRSGDWLIFNNVFRTQPLSAIMPKAAGCFLEWQWRMGRWRDWTLIRLGSQAFTGLSSSRFWEVKYWQIQLTGRSL